LRAPRAIVYDFADAVSFILNGGRAIQGTVRSGDAVHVVG